MTNTTPDEIHVCNKCNEMHYDEVTECEYCQSDSIRVVDKSDLGYFD